MSNPLNSMPKFTANNSRHVHDVSQSTAFTCCPGHICPVYYDMLHTGDKLHFSASEFVRLNPLEGQPLGEIDVHLDYFFVPLSVMYTPSTSMFYQTDDLLSSQFVKSSFSDTTKFPVYNFGNFIPSLTSDIAMFNYQAVAYMDNGIPVRYWPYTFDSIGKSVFRMFDFFDMNPNILLDTLGEVDDPDGGRSIEDYPKFTPWFALAYQAIYQLYFRNDEFEPKNYHYNIDKYYNTNLINEDAINSKNIFQINYCSRSKDYFNSIQPSVLTNTISSLSPSALKTAFQSVNSWLSATENRPIGADGSPVSLLKDGSQLKSYLSGGSSSSSINGTGAIRSLFMSEKLLRVIGRAEKNYESQFLAHFGVKIPHDPLHNITHIGHDMVTMRPDSVIAMANTYNADSNSGSALGEIGGQGHVMLQGKKHSFEAPFHGVFLVLSHIVPRRRYVLSINKLHQLNYITDFWQPEFDKKGKQPLFAYEAIFDASKSDTHSMSRTLGWQYAYEQFKRKSDRVMRAFQPTRSSQNANNYAPWVISNFPFGYLSNNGAASSFLRDGSQSLHAYDLIVSPNDLNANMVVPFNASVPSEVVGVTSDQHRPWLIYQTDPFICDFNLYCKKVNYMSEYGEPEL